MFLIDTNSENGRRHRHAIGNSCLIDTQIPKTAGLACSEGLLDLLVHEAEGLVDFGETLVFICETFKMRWIFSRSYGNRINCQVPDSSSYFTSGTSFSPG